VTLIITTVADDAVTQTSDLRLTLPTGLEYKDSSIKSTIVFCRDAKFVIGYTGLALIGKIRTDHWLVDHLSNSGAGQKVLSELVEDLRAHAASVFSKLRSLGNLRRTSFIIAGFSAYGPFFALVTNSEDAQGRRLSIINDAFDIHWFVRNQGSKGMAMITIGQESALKPNLVAVAPKILKRLTLLAPQDRLKLCLDITRRAHGHPKYGSSIGSDYLGTVLPRVGDATGGYYPENASPISYSPHIVGPVSTIRDAYVATEEQTAAKERVRVMSKLWLSKT
jgi:hypothetical protein